MNNTILNNIRIIDLTRVLAGPYCTRILADFGAEVIKVQSTKTSTGVETNNTPYFNTWNRNKRSITLDVTSTAGKDLFLRLVGMSDVVVENFSSRVMPNLGLDYDQLKKIKQDIIMLSMSGLGRTGPWKDFTAFAPTVQSLSAMTYLTSFKKDSPMGPGFSYADIIAGLYGAFAVLAALEYQEQSGQGQYIDLSEFEAMGTVLGPTFLDVMINKKDILPQGNDAGYLHAAPYGCYPCLGLDQWCVIAVFDDHEWKALCDVMGSPSWTQDQRFGTLAEREKNKQALDAYLSKWTHEKNAEDIVMQLQEAGVPAGIVQDAEGLAHDPQLVARGFFTEIHNPISGKILTDTFPVVFKRGYQIDLKAAPLLGEDNEYVFGELLGLSDIEIERLKEQGIIN